MNSPQDLTVSEYVAEFWIAEELKGQAEPFMLARARAQVEKNKDRIVVTQGVDWRRPDALSPSYRPNVWVGVVSSYAVEV